MPYGKEKDTNSFLSMLVPLLIFCFYFVLFVWFSRDALAKRERWACVVCKVH